MHSDTGVRQGYTNFSKFDMPPQHSRCETGNKAISHCGTTNIRCNGTNLVTSATWYLGFFHPRVRMQHVYINTAGTHLTRAIIFGSTVTKKVPIFGISYVVSTMTNTSTDCAHTNTIYHFTRMAVVPMLVHKLPLCYCESTKFVTETVLILKLTTALQFRWMYKGITWYFNLTNNVKHVKKYKTLGINSLSLSPLPPQYPLKSIITTMRMRNSSNKCNSISLFLMSPFRQAQKNQCWHFSILVSGSWSKLGLFKYAL